MDIKAKKIKRETTLVPHGKTKIRGTKFDNDPKLSESDKAFWEGKPAKPKP